MSKMIPYSVVNVLRKFVDVTLNNYGIDCELFIPTNSNDLEDLGVYKTIADFTYEKYFAKIFVEWSPNVHRLRKLGIFSENESPMIARFGSFQTSTGFDLEQVEIIQRSYVKIPMQYTPDVIDTDEFELVDIQVENAHDAIAVKMWKLVPRRVKP